MPAYMLPLVRSTILRACARKPMDTPDISRRQFLRRTGAAAGLAGAGLLSDSPLRADEQKKRIALFRDPEDRLSAAAPVPWAVRQLSEALAKRGFSVSLRQRLAEVADDETCLLAGGATAALPRDLLAKAGIKAPSGSEALVLLAGR